MSASAPASHFVARETCPVCGSSARTELFSRPMLDEPLRGHLVRQYEAVGTIELEYLEGAIFSVVECSGCTLVYHAEVPDDVLMARVYDVWINADRALASLRAARDLNQRLRFVRELALAERRLRKGDAQLRVLDFGMGWGAWCAMAMAMGCEVHGHESSPVRIAHAERAGVKVLSWDDLPQHPMDFINSEQVFEHLADPLGALTHLASALAPGGLLKISVPDGADIKRRLAIGDWDAGEDSPRSLLSITPLQHVNCFSRRSLVELARRAGLAPATLTLSELYGSNADIIAPGNLLAALTRPLGRRLFASDTYLFFERA